jgi:hypothetical protein
MKNKKPKISAITVIIMTNRSNSYRRGVLGVELEEAKLAIYPNTVKSPIRITTPLPLPSFTKVPKNARFFVSRGSLGWEHSTERN